MKQFQFSLQAVHDLRQMACEQAERELAQAMAQVSEAAARIDEITRLRATAIEVYLAKLQAGALAPHEAALHAHHLHSLAQREAEARVCLGSLERERERRCQLVMEAAREAETTARLREREAARHRAELARAEQKLLDEMATEAFARRQAEKR
jgi:flagellar FliJ protein